MRYTVLIILLVIGFNGPMQRVSTAGTFETTAQDLLPPRQPYLKQSAKLKSKRLMANHYGFPILLTRRGDKHMGDMVWAVPLGHAESVQNEH